MKSRPTIIDVAKESGFSKSTVSLVFRNSPNIPASTRAVILAAAEKIGYRPNLFARNLRTSSSNTIGMLIPDNTNPYYTELTNDVEEQLNKAGFDLIVSETREDPTQEYHLLEHMRERQVDGIIIIPLIYDKIAKIIKSYEASGIHCVIAGYPGYDIPFDSVDINVRQATVAAIEYLIKLGHRELAFVCGAPDWQGLGGRLQAFRETLKLHGLTVHDSFIHKCGFRLEDGYNAGKYLLSLHPRPTAVFALNDLLAISVMRAAKDLGLNIPSDVSVVGVDNIALASYTIPSLTTVATPIKQVSQELVQLMLNGLKNRDQKPKRIEIISTLLLRESTAAPPALQA